MIPAAFCVYRVALNEAAKGALDGDTKNMKHGRAFIAKSEPTGFIASHYISMQIYYVPGSEQAIFDDHFSENPNPQEGAFFVNCFSALDYDSEFSRVPDTWQTENFAENRRILCA